MKEFIDKLIERLEEERSKLQDAGYCYGLEDAIKMVNELAKEYKHCTLCYLQSPCEYQNENVMLPNELLADGNGWISCSERLPEADHYVLCQGNHSMFVACVDSLDGEWRDNHFYKRTTVKAWMPLPTPYTEGE